MMIHFVEDLLPLSWKDCGKSYLSAITTMLQCIILSSEHDSLKITTVNNKTIQTKFNPWKGNLRKILQAFQLDKLDIYQIYLCVLSIVKRPFMWALNYVKNTRLNTLNLIMIAFKTVNYFFVIRATALIFASQIFLNFDLTNVFSINHITL